VDPYRWLPRRVRWLTFGLLLSSLASASAAAPPRAGSARACLTFQREESERALIYRGQNACDRRLECQMSYELSCQDLDGKDTVSSEEELHFDIGAKRTEPVVLSAEVCEHGWKISDVAWDCI
jgi:hypothetical protein